MKVKKDHVIVRQGDKGNWYLKTTFVYDQNTTRPPLHPPPLTKKLQREALKLISQESYSIRTPKKERSGIYHILENIGD